ncbi:MAG TPA: glycine oxidase ThiO [Mycobacteriales bacterium]|nr:glycine oxidase ThiO [Mycobacteriales bacterium]
MTDASYDVVVVGGGVIGLACGWRLTQRGARVAVVDPSPASAATHVAAGMLAPVTEIKYGEEQLLQLALESLRRYPAFVSELESVTGHSVGLRTEGTLLVATDAGDRAMLAELHAFQTSLGLDATMLTSREARALEPALSPDVRSGLLAASDHSIDNRLLAAALLAALGASLVRERVTSVEIVDNTVHAVRLGDGSRLATPTVLLAAGSWSARVAGIPEFALPPIRPVKGEILRLRSRGAVGLPAHSVRAFVNGHEVYLVPRTHGELVVGATVEEQGFDVSVRAGAVRELLRDARAILPLIDELELVEVTAGLRPGTPDNRPLIGESASVAGLHLATGHYRNGVLLAPVTADLVADSISGAEPPSRWAVAPSRFEAVSR